MSRMDRMRAAMMGEDVPSGTGPSAGGRGGGRGRGARGGPNPTAGLAGAGSIAERTAIAAAASHLTKERSRREREAAAPAVRAAAEAGHKTVAGDLDPEGPPSARPAKRRRAAAGPMRSEVSDPNADAFDDDVEIVRESDAADELATRGIHVHALSDRGAILATLNPSFVVVYDPDAAFIREIETHKASRPGAPMRVYFLVHDTSLEEQRYLSSVRYETGVRRSRPRRNNTWRCPRSRRVAWVAERELTRLGRTARRRRPCCRCRSSPPPPIAPGNRRRSTPACAADSSPCRRGCTSSWTCASSCRRCLPSCTRARLSSCR